MKEQLISFETAKLAKEKGFDEGCKKYYSTDKQFHSSKQILTHKSLRSGGYLISTQSLLQKWQREKHNTYIVVELDQTSDPKFCFIIRKFYKSKCQWDNLLGNKTFSDLYYTYEEALEQGLQEALKLI